MMLDQWKVEQIDPTAKGGQHVGCRTLGMTVTHVATGVSLTIPAEIARRSQHQTRNAAIDGLTLALLQLGVPS